MPKDLAGHCLLNIGNGKMFLHGGISVRNNHNESVIEVSHQSWILENSAWVEVRHEPKPKPN